MSTAIDKHIALLCAFVRENVFATWHAFHAEPRIPWGTLDVIILVAALTLPTRVANTLASATVTPPLAAAVHEHVALVLARISKEILGTDLAYRVARESRRTLIGILALFPRIRRVAGTIA